MTKAEFLNILERNLDGTASKAERRLLDDFYRHHLAQAKTEWTLTEKERIRLEIFESLNSAIDDDLRQNRSIGPRRMWQIAACAAIFLAAGIALYLTRSAPEKLQYATVTTGRGEQRTVTLSDGSVVKLNAESSMTFPEPFAESEVRNVQLTGEAFFDVAREEARPFIIRSHDLVTTVLGTSFNIRAYPEDESIAVTVATGKVQVAAADAPHHATSVALLGQGEQGSYNKMSAAIAKTSVELENYLAWKDGTILLQGASLKEAAGILERWYDVEFVFTNSDLKACTIDGKFRNDQLENILENLRFLVGLEYHIEAGNKIIIDGQSCN